MKVIINSIIFQTKLPVRRVGASERRNSSFEKVAEATRNHGRAGCGASDARTELLGRVRIIGHLNLEKQQ